MTENNEEIVNEEVEAQSLADFLEKTPPNQERAISDLSITRWLPRGVERYYFAQPELKLPCDHKGCEGVRYFRPMSEHEEELDFSPTFFHVTYRCSNCKETKKVFSLVAIVNKEEKKSGLCYKLGEYPAYGPRVPPKLLELIGPDRDTFLKGRRCENQGLGVGAFSYYRRVVENQRTRIIQKIIKVLKKLNPKDEKIKQLEEAIKETQFSRSLEMAKDSLPESLLIDGHSPIELLHSALSEGLHNLSDEECLESAHNVRLVLVDLSDRLAQALKNEAELKEALSQIMKRKKT